jgi:hypothetical protein
MPSPPRRPGAPLLDNAFHPDFLAGRLDQDGEPASAGEVETAVPWQLHSEGGEHHLYRLWEGREHGDRPFGVFQDWETALLFFAAVPATGRPPLYTLDPEGSERGYTLRRDGEVVGHLSLYQPEVAQAASVLAALARSTTGQAAVLTAVGSAGIRQIGQVLGRQAIWRILGREGEGVAES